jgi:MFS family permease
VCEDNWKPATGQSLFFLGAVLGSLGLGVMADYIGRLPVLVLSNILALLGNVATSFAHQLPEFAASRLLAGLSTDTNFFMMYIIGESGASSGC